MRKLLLPVIWTIVVILVAVFFGPDFDGVEGEAHRYCRMVHEGKWPDFRENYSTYCDGPKWNGK